MTLDIRLSQLDEVQTRLDELFNHIDALHRKLDDLKLAAAPIFDAPELPPKVNRTRKAKASPAATPTATDVTEDHDAEDEDTLRARVEFEAKRTTRQFGIGGTRAAISRVADGALRVDDVPAAHLAAVLTALQAL
jgi:hypothetical protein